MKTKDLSNLAKLKAVGMIVPACLEIWQHPQVPAEMLGAALFMAIGIMLTPKK